MEKVETVCVGHGYGCSQPPSPARRFAVCVTGSNFTMLQKIIEKYVYVPLERNCKLELALSDDYDHAEMAQSWKKRPVSRLCAKVIKPHCC